MAGKCNTSKCNNSRDIFIASVINQKAVNQNTQQALVIVAAQVIKLIEAQFGFSTNTDND